MPFISIIIAAYNEEKVIAQKIENCLALDYPPENMEIIVASDGSTDATNDIVRGFVGNGVKLVALPSNQGKSSAQNRAVEESGGEILFFTDANVMLRTDAMLKIIRNFYDGNVGCVVGKVTYLNEGETSVSQGEGFYWQYELFLRKKESELGNFAMGSGPILTIRRSLFEPLDPAVGEDFVLPIIVAMKGYRIVYEPTAISEEILFQTKPANMFRTKVRIISKDLRGLFMFRNILNPLRFPLYAWGLISHKLLRWLVPFFLLFVFISNLMLLNNSVYFVLFMIQIIFYALAALGLVLQGSSRPPFYLGIPFSFCLVNLASLVGVTKFVIGKKSGKWDPVR